MTAPRKAWNRARDGCALCAVDYTTDTALHCFWGGETDTTCRMCGEGREWHTQVAQPGWQMPERCEDCPIARQTSGEASIIKRPPGG